ncbi:hypothetical protein KIN20_004161 [Parelaphostrongylus tenuis]|uniref:Uncharacterized protein n=1 Tax=Parelaphostrongylus tenuis TaxID=148309 RepID=A0AAD5M080_PARTN|nr:hypothetical protein KIN20_004161 [Parelaphostrongylus tenuis]
MERQNARHLSDVARRTTAFKSLQEESGQYQEKYFEWAASRPRGKAGKEPDMFAHITVVAAPRGKATARRHPPVNAGPQKCSEVTNLKLSFGAIYNAKFMLWYITLKSVV